MTHHTHHGGSGSPNPMVREEALKNLSRSIRNRMHELGLQDAGHLASHVGISRALAYQLINGQANPRLDTLLTVCSGLQMSVASAFGGDANG